MFLLVSADLGSPVQRGINWLCVCLRLCIICDCIVFMPFYASDVFFLLHVFLSL